MCMSILAEVEILYDKLYWGSDGLVGDRVSLRDPMTYTLLLVSDHM